MSFLDRFRSRRRPEPPSAPLNTPPASLGHYDLKERIGAGGMGTVYRAIDRRSGAVVAVKVLHPHLSSIALYMERFRREASIASRLDSRYMVRVLDSGSDKGHEFIVTEFVDGARLGDVLREGPLEVVQALAVAAQVAQALEEAALHGVIHRDIKPDNIMFTKRGEIKVADFGISRLSDATTVTVTGMFVGTLAYIAPEQARGQADIRSDMYSLGITLFEMLTGELPFHSATPTGLMRQHEEEPPPLEKLEGLPPSVIAIVARCLQKDPASRYQHPSELRAEIEASRRIVAPPLSDTWIATVTTTLADTRIASLPKTVIASAGPEPSPAAGGVGGGAGRPPLAPQPMSGGFRGRLPIAVGIAGVVLLAAGIGGALALTGGSSDNGGTDDSGGGDVPTSTRTKSPSATPSATPTPTPTSSLTVTSSSSPTPTQPVVTLPPPPPTDDDGDGVPNNFDRCRYQFAKTPSGCPDSDGDGVVDLDDECDNVPAATANGCPPPPSDRDGDGKIDSEDSCPDLPGTLSNGCPPSVTAGEWTSNYVVDFNDCGFGPAKGTTSTKAFIFKEKGSGDGVVYQGEVFELWEGSTNWGDLTLAYPTLAWYLPLERVEGGITYTGKLTLQIDFHTFNTGDTYAWEQYDLVGGSCTIYHADPSGRPPEAQ